MAAQSKTTAVHFSLIFFVMLSVILGVVAYLFYADFRENEAKYVKMQQDTTAIQSANRRYLDEITELKKLVGVNVEEVGVVNPGENTVKGQALTAIRTFGTDPASNDMVTALRDLREQLDKQAREIGERQATIAGLQTQVQALKGQYDTVAKQHDQQRAKTEQDLSGEQQKFQESIASKDRELANLRQQLNAVQTELAQTREQLTADVRNFQQRNAELVLINQKLADEVDRQRGESFEVADGEVIRVDQVARTVWVNIGAKDGVRKRTTFSVYPKNNLGVGRSSPSGGRAEDVKGSIEITRIIDSKLSEARILDDMSARPIAPGDVIYTPLWSAGRAEKFAFAGMIDIDGDGSYTGDRERLHEVLAATGAEIVSEVTDEGERVGGPINEQTHFLVVGATPDFTQEPDATRKAQLRAMSEARKEMEDEARRHGVKVINLTQFLDFIGYVPQRSLWVPGGDGNFTLDAGMDRFGNSRSRGMQTGAPSGANSALFGTRGRAAQPKGSQSPQR